MPRLYTPVQNSSYFVGRSGREDAAAARAQEVNQRAMLQRQQGYRQYAQTRQAGQMQRQAQRQAQQQQALQIQQRREDRDFQLQRDVFGAQRDYGMQERRIGAAAEQAQLGREFETEQLDTRFGQQQDMARQEQEYRLEQLDIAAQDRFLSAEQQAEIQRESDFLRSDLNRQAASEGRFEQFGYGQLAAEEAARRPLSVAERQRLRFSDELSARSQARGAGYRAEEQVRGADIATDQAYLRQGFAEKNAELAKVAKEEYLDLSTEAQMRVNDQLQNFKYDFQSQEVQDRIWVEKQRQDAAEQSEERHWNKVRDRQAMGRRDNLMAADIEAVENNPKLDPEEKRVEIERIRQKWDDIPLKRFYGTTPKSRADDAIYEDKQGRVLSVPQNGPPSLISQPPPRPVTVGGTEYKEGDTYEEQGTRYIVKDGKPWSMGRSKSGEVQDRNITKWKMDRTSLQRELGKTVKVKDPITERETEQPAYTPEKAAQILAAFDERWDKILNPPPPVEPEEPAGPGGWDPAVGAGPRELPATDVPPFEEEGTGDWEEDPWTWKPPGAKEAEILLDEIRRKPVDKVWASNQKELLKAKNAGREFKDWTPQDQATYLKALDDLETPGEAEPPSAPRSAPTTLPSRRPMPLP